MSSVRGPVFISYSRHDAAWKERILTSLRKDPALDGVFWDDTQIRPGAKWKPQIVNALFRAEVALLLVSQNFIESEFITRTELPRLLKRAANEAVTILWVSLSDCQYEETPLKDYQSALNPSRPLDALDADALNVAIAKIGDAIQEALNPEPDFRGFFGDECLSEPYPAVFLDAELPKLKGRDLRIVNLTNPPEELRDDGDRCEHCEFPLGSALPYGVRQIVPFWELNAVLKLDRIFRSFSPSGVEVRLDSDFKVELPSRGCVCLGLGFNRLTKRLGDESGAFELFWEDQTDHFKTRCWNNREKRDLGMVNPEERDGMEFALFARLLLPPSKPVPHIVVAGHTADGTRAACSYLVRDWRKLWKKKAYRKYLDDHHMTGVLYHCDGNAESFEPDLTNVQFVPAHWRTLPAVRRIL